MHLGNVLHPVPDLWYYQTDLFSLRSSPITVGVDMNHAIIVVVPSLPMFLTVVPEWHPDVTERQSSVLDHG